MRIRQRDITVWPDEIERADARTSSPHIRPPRELVEGKPKFGADFGEAGARFTINMNLPRQRNERGEVVFSWLGLDPRQAVAAEDAASRAARAQRTFDVVDADLGYSAKKRKVRALREGEKSGVSARGRAGCGQIGRLRPCAGR